MYGVDYIAFVSCIYYAFHHMKSCKLFSMIEKKYNATKQKTDATCLAFSLSGTDCCVDDSLCAEKTLANFLKNRSLLVLDFVLTFCQNID